MTSEDIKSKLLQLFEMLFLPNTNANANLRKHSHIQTFRQTDIHTHRETDTWTHRQTYRETDTQTDT